LFQNLSSWEQTTLTNRNEVHDEITERINSGNACYCSGRKFLSSCVLLKHWSSGYRPTKQNVATSFVWVWNTVSSFWRKNICHRYFKITS